MTDYTTATETPTPCIDLLPLRAGKRGVLRWTAASDDYSQLAGFLELYVGGETATYSVTESPTHTGRTFMLTKLGGKPIARKHPGYVVTCTHAGDEAVGSCECDGKRFSGHCRHLDACSTLLLNGWI